MKKKILVALATIAAGLFVFTGCQKEKPYATYELATTFSGLPEKSKDDTRSYQEWLESLPADQKDILRVADYVAGWLIDNSYIMTRSLGNPIIIEGDNLTLLDPQAYNLYRNKVGELDKVDLNQVVVDGQKLQNEDKKVVVTTYGTISFAYQVTGITTLPSTDAKIKWYSVSYGPLNSNPE